MENNTIEQNFEKIEEIIATMQSDDITLDKSFDLYNEGLKLIKDCNEKIEKVETQIKIIEKENVDE